MSARFPLSLRLFFTTCLCLCVCLAAGCSGKQVHVTVENEFNMMAKRLAPVLKAHGVIDEHGAYVAPVFSTPELPPQLGEYLFQRLSPAFRFKVDPALLPPTFALSRTAGDTVEMQPYGFMLGQGADIVTVTLLAQTDWNDDGLNEWLLLCRVKPIIGKNNMRDYYLLVEKPGASILVPKLLAVYDCLSQSCKLFVDVDQKKPPYAPEEPTIEVKIGQKDVTLPPNAPPPPGAPQHAFHPGHELGGGKRLDDVVIRAHFKALDPIKDLALGRQHDDGHLAGLPDLGADRPAIHHRQHDVQQDQVRFLLLELLQCFAAVPSDADIKAFLYQIHVDQVGDILIVFYNQNVASHRVSSVLRGLPVPFLMFFSTLYYPKLRQALVAIDKLCADLLSTNFFLVEADCYHRFADGTLNLDDALDCCRICVKQPFIFTTWTCHMHFLHSISPPVRGQLKGNVKLTVDYIRQSFL